MEVWQDAPKEIDPRKALGKAREEIEKIVVERIQTSVQQERRNGLTYT